MFSCNTPHPSPIIVCRILYPPPPIKNQPLQVDYKPPKLRKCTPVHNALTRAKATFHTGPDTQKTTQNHYTKKPPQKQAKTTPQTPKIDPKQTTPHQQHPQNTHHKNTKPPDKAKDTKTYTQTQHQKTKKNNRTPEHPAPTTLPLRLLHSTTASLHPPALHPF